MADVELDADADSAVQAFDPSRAVRLLAAGVGGGGEEGGGGHGWEPDFSIYVYHTLVTYIPRTRVRARTMYTATFPPTPGCRGYRPGGHGTRRRRALLPRFSGGGRKAQSPGCL